MVSSVARAALDELRQSCKVEARPCTWTASGASGSSPLASRSAHCRRIVGRPLAAVAIRGSSGCCGQQHLLKPNEPDVTDHPSERLRAFVAVRFPQGTPRFEWPVHAELGGLVTAGRMGGVIELPGGIAALANLGIARSMVSDLCAQASS